jgi:lysozyme family protein
MSDFEKSLQYVFANEGVGYETWPEIDQPTNTGIIAADIAQYRRVALSSVTANDVKNLAHWEIKNIYKSLFWDKMRLDEVKDYGIATCIFDTGVNRGVETAIKYAQRTCNLLGSALVSDGIMGFHTLSAINRAERAPFITKFENLETAGYLAIIAAHPKDERYRTGWLNRARRLFSLI